MWIVEQKTGTLSAVERYKDPISGKYKTVAVKIKKDTPQERKKAYDILNERIRKKTLKEDDIKLHELIQMYLAGNEGVLLKQTLVRNERALLKTEEILGGDNYATKLTPIYIKQQFKKSGKSHTTLNEYIKRLKACYRWAYHEQLLKDISAVASLIPYKDVTRKEKLQNKYLERTELALLLESMKVEEWNLLTEFLVLSGMRIGEVIALNDEDVTDETIDVDKSFSTIIKAVGGTKTYASTRVIHVQPQLRDCINRIRLFMRKRKWLCEKESKLFWCDTNGSYMHYDTYRMYFKENTFRILGRKLTPHSLRHTHASLLAETLPLDTIMRRLGHADSNITKDIYIHVTKETQRRDAMLIDSANIL